MELLYLAGKLFWQLKLNKQLFCELAILLLALYPREIITYVHKKICTRMCVTALFATAKHWKLPKYPLTGEEINKSLYAHTMGNYSAIKEQTNDAHNNMDKLKKHVLNERHIRVHTKNKEYIRYDFIYIHCKNRQR